MPESLQEYHALVAKRLADRLADKSPPEVMAYLQQATVLREAVRQAGVEDWGEAHTMGALWTCTAFTTALNMARQVGLISASTETKVRLLVEEQEIVSVLMGYRP